MFEFEDQCYRFSLRLRRWISMGSGSIILWKEPQDFVEWNIIMEAKLEDNGLLEYIKTYVAKIIASDAQDLA